ncbi:MAG TPA: nitrilase family protein [Chitinophagaceae bacterium]|nr:nitrilase family protein [Chitinophagaceae bacterium]
MSTLTVTVIQSQLHWKDAGANLQMFEEKIKSIGEKTEMVVLPEMFNTGFISTPQPLAETMDGPTVEWMKRIAAEHRIILTGSLIIKEDGKYFNRLIWMLPVGQYGHYDKRHLFAFASEHEEYTAGNKRLITSVKGFRLNMQICYDLRFPVWASQQSFASPLMRKRRVSNFDAYKEIEHPEYDALVYVANWPERRNHAWKTLLQARAIENQCYVIGVNRVGKDGNDINYSGDSMVIDPLGEVLYQKPDDEDIFTVVLKKERVDEIRSQFPFWKDADNFMILPDDAEPS